MRRKSYLHASATAYLLQLITFFGMKASGSDWITSIVAGQLVQLGIFFGWVLAAKARHKRKIKKASKEDTSDQTSVVLKFSAD